MSIPVGPFRGALEWPVPGRLAGRFGQPGATAGTLRNGIEVASAINTPVRAVHDGMVDYAEGFTGLGTLVIVDHGANTYSLYGYLAEALVKRETSCGPARKWAGWAWRRSGASRRCISSFASTAVWPIPYNG